MKPQARPIPAAPLPLPAITRADVARIEAARAVDIPLSRIEAARIEADRRARFLNMKQACAYAGFNNAHTLYCALVRDGVRLYNPTGRLHVIRVGDLEDWLTAKGSADVHAIVGALRAATATRGR